MKIKVNKDFAGFTKGQVIEFPDAQGLIPPHSYWRRRLRDAIIDNCCEVVTESKPKTPTKAKADKPKTSKGED